MILFYFILMRQTPFISLFNIVQNNVMNEILSWIVIFLSLVGTLSYDQRDKYQEIMSYYQNYSYSPFLHLYYNSYFKNSKYFEDFVTVVRETQYRNRDYARFLFSDCDRIQEGKSRVCQQMKRTKESHLIVGFAPSGAFIKYAGKKMQTPPNTKPFKRTSSNYRVQEFQSFINQLMPNFYESINNLEQFQHWLQPKYAPNIIFATRQQDIPLVIAQIAVHYFLRFDFGFLNGLSQKIVSRLSITTFPTLMVVKYNFKNDSYELHKYPGKDFSTDNYDEIKAFLQPLALIQQRNDILFHKIKKPQSREIRTTQNIYELNQMLDRADGWVLISQFKDQPSKLYGLKQKYGQYFQYFHYLNLTEETEIIKLYNPQNKKTTILSKNDVQWSILSKDQFLKNTSTMLAKNVVVMGVRQKYKHFCTLAASAFLRGITYCFILKEQDYEQTQKELKNTFDYGFVCRQIIAQDGAIQVTGNNFNSDKFQNVYDPVEYHVRQQSKQIVRNLLQSPINNVTGSKELSELCSDSFKKCALIFTRTLKSGGKFQDQLKEVAKNFINDYLFYEIDLECNSHFQQEIQSLQKSNNGLIVYHPQQQTYVHLKAKLSRSTFQRFLQANLGDKKLPHRKWKVQYINAQSCKVQTKNTADPDKIEVFDDQKANDL